jgi:hypothetical protein
MKNSDYKSMIIENYIEWYTTDDQEREEMKEGALLYVEEDHVDEIESAIERYKKEMLMTLTIIKRKIEVNSVDAWESNLENTACVAIQQDFDIATGEDEYETVKYNGWAEDLDRLIASLK